MSPTEFIVGTVQVRAGDGLRVASDFAVRLQRKEVEAHAGVGLMSLTARWAGGAVFVASTPSPYATLMLDELGQEFVIHSIRTLAVGQDLLALTVERRRSSALTAAPAPEASDKAPLPDRITSQVEDLRCPHCNVVILKRERIRPGAERGGAPEFCPRCGERTGR